MKSDDIDGILIQMHNRGKTVAFWQDLGYEVEFETDHHSARLRHPCGGPYLFVAECPADHPLQLVLGIRVPDAAHFKPPSSAVVIHPFEKQHWPARRISATRSTYRLLNSPGPTSPADPMGSAVERRGLPGGLPIRL